MVHANDIRQTILRLAEERGKERPFRLADVAREVDRKNWRMLIDQVKLVAHILIREGKIIAAPSGRTIDFFDASTSLRYMKKP